MDGIASDAAERVRRALSNGSFVDPEREAAALVEAAGQRGREIDELVRRRLDGEPLAWIVGSVTFAGVRVLVDRGVFVPRPHTEALARRAVELLPEDGIAVDLCTGSGAVAVAMRSARPNATVVATDVDETAVRCARRNGIDATRGDLDEPVSASLRRRVDVVTAVVPYVPAEELHLLPRDVFEHEPRRALDGGAGGTAVLVRAVAAAERLVRRGGGVLLELGGDQAAAVGDALTGAGFVDVHVHSDEDGRDRAIEARLG